MAVAILGMGTAVPPHRITRAEAIAAARILANCDADKAASLAVLYDRTDVEGRYMTIGRDVLQDVLDGTNKSGSRFVPRGPADRGPDTAERMRLYERDALPLAWQASRAALTEAHVAASAVTHLVTVSCTGFAAPGFDIGLIKKLGLPTGVARTHIGFMGCHGAFNAMRVARAFVESDPGGCVLICATELSSLHYYYTWNPKRMVGNALFGDGAAAVVVAGDAQQSGRPWRHVDSGSSLFPDSEQALTWSIGNHGFDMTLSTRVPGLIAQHLRPWLMDWLAGQHLPLNKVRSWALHPGGPRVLGAIEETLGLAEGTAAASRDVLQEFGNMSSPTILFIIDCLRRRAAHLPCVALGFGPGMVVEGMLFA
jgi:predicted naringenin-chalcone synthase